MNPAVSCSARGPAGDSRTPWPSPLRLPPRLEPDLLVRIRERVAGDEAERRLLEARPVAAEEGGLEDRREHGALVHELLDAVQHRLTLLRIELDRLIAEQPVDVRIAAVGSDAAGDDERLDARGGVAGRGAAGPDELLEALFLIALVERGALERAELHANAHRHEIVDDDLRRPRVHGVGGQLTGVEAARIARPVQELPGPGRVVGLEGRRPAELEGVGNDARADPGEAQILGV